MIHQVLLFDTIDESKPNTERPGYHKSIQYMSIQELPFLIIMYI